jgi:ABC-type multidrug transport system permease subunit
LTDIILRFFIGGLVVSAFSFISDLLKPKTFAGLFGAAPSIALATLALTVLKQGKQYAAIEARSMILGAIAFLVYATAVSYLLLRFKFSALPVTLVLLLLWLGVATGLWYVMTG